MSDTRRSEIEIIGEILKLTRRGAKKTEILYQGNLSYAQLQTYLAFLLDKDILEEHTVQEGNGFATMYKSTAKGKDLLGDIKRTLNYLK